MTIYTATSQAQADQMLGAMVGGDTLKLVGSFGPWRPGGRRFTAPVTIDCTAATLSDIYTGGWDNVTWLGGQWKIGQQYKTALRDEGSNKCRYKDMAIDGAAGPLSGYDTAIWLRGGSEAVIDNPAIRNAQNGILAFDINGLKVLGGSITDTGSDAIQFADCNILIDGIALRGLKPVSGDHPDLIQGRSSKGKPRCDVTIQNVEAEGNGQGVFVTPDTEGTGFGTVTVQNNKISAGYPRGITVVGALVSKVIGNDVSTLPGSPWQVSIQCPASDGTNVRSGNIVHAYIDPAGYTRPEIRDPDYVAPAPTPAPSPAPTPDPAPEPAPAPAPVPAPAPKPKPVRRKIKASMVVDGTTYTGTLTEKLA